MSFGDEIAYAAARQLGRLLIAAFLIGVIVSALAYWWSQ